jgi:hypothetical protein
MLMRWPCVIIYFNDVSLVMLLIYVIMTQIPNANKKKYLPLTPPIASMLKGSNPQGEEQFIGQENIFWGKWLG